MTQAHNSDFESEEAAPMEPMECQLQSFKSHQADKKTDTTWTAGHVGQPTGKIRFVVLLVWITSMS